MTEITQEGWKNKALSMLLAQLTSYVLLIAATVIPSPGTVPIIPLIIAALTLAAFVVFWPFRGSMLDRIVTLVFGAISLIFVIVPFPTGKVPPDQTAADGSVLPWYSWALAMGLLLVVLGPLAGLDLSDLALRYEDLSRDVERQAETYRREGQAQLELGIRQRTAAYISEKAAQLGLSCHPRVEVTWRDGVPYPGSVTLDMAENRALSAILEEDLGIPPSEQHWLG